MVLYHHGWLENYKGHENCLKGVLRCAPQGGVLSYSQLEFDVKSTFCLRCFVEVSFLVCKVQVVSLFFMTF